MNFTRRHFLISSSLLPLASSEWEEEVRLDKFRQDEIRFVQSVTDAESTLIVVVAHKSRKLQITATGPQEVPSPQFSVEVIDFKLAEYLIYQIHVRRLVPSSLYKLDIYDQSSGRFHRRTFKSLEVLKPGAKLALLTCSSHRRAGPQKTMFSQLQNAQVDAILFAGDLVYANSSMDTALGRPATPKEVFAIYIKTFFELDFYNQKHLTPIFSTWDDHDMGMNNADRNHPFLELVTRIFRAFFPADNRVSSLEVGPGVAFSMSLFGTRFILTDCRSFMDIDAESIYGEPQLKWICEQIEKSEQPLAIVSSIQFWDYGRLAETVSETAPLQWKKILDSTEKVKKPILYISGDVHYSQIQKLPSVKARINTFEITSSAMFSLSARIYGKRSEKQGQLAYYGYPNFLVLEKKEASQNRLAFQVRCISEKSNAQFVRDIEIKV